MRGVISIVVRVVCGIGVLGRPEKCKLEIWRMSAFVLSCCLVIFVLG